ncbi:protein lifeguard 3-like [Silurus meridionalis]|uniref:Uncharacterized protein n=1 Tax=Silurus meridionalis TaxID=175797 RepID=A0A8T0ANC7_SILME|nr:protein lifeguard 3-like [Silurus meridionalis]KAF7694442.1 hypothetical protein HF521_008195 [Silurus meridionalis]
MFMSDLLPIYANFQNQGYGFPFTPHTYPNPELPEAGKRFISTDMLSGDPWALYHGAVWKKKSTRHEFIRKVFLILVMQLFVVNSFTAMFTFTDPVRLFIIQNPVFYWFSLAMFFSVYILLEYCEKRRQFPVNLFLLLIFTLTMSFTAGTVSSYYKGNGMLVYLGIILLACAAITVFSFQTKVDLLSGTGLVCVLSILLLITGIITAIIVSIHLVELQIMLFAAILAIFYMLFLVYRTRTLLEGRTRRLKPNEYVFGALHLYANIALILLLLCIGFSSN